MGKSILWGLLSGFSFLGAIGFAVSIAVTNENIHPSFYLGLAFCLVAMIFFGDKSTKAFEIWQAKLVHDIIDDESEMMHWKYSGEEWFPFAESNYVQSRKLAKWIFGVLFTCLIIGVIIVVFTAENVNGLRIEIAVGAIASFLGGLWWVTNSHYRRVKLAYFKSENPEVHIGKKGLVINREFLVVFSNKTTRVSTIEVVEKHNTQCLYFLVLMNSGDEQSKRKHYIPIPNGETVDLERFKKLLLH
ncbi:MAG: hypothetical protein ACJAWV_004269 [Flammeovirgaceae bacterium]|jgi:hypothetical protein